MPDENKRIIVRDRREVHQFSIHNRVIDEWLPIIDKYGFVLYSLYVRMSNKADERSWPGYSLTSEHLGLGRTTISNYNRLLVWCRLIHIEHGDRKTSNEYYILNVPTCTPDDISDIEKKAREHYKPKDTFLQALLNRLQTWQPIQEHWKKPGKTVVVVHPSQLPLPETKVEKGSPARGLGSPTGEHPSPTGEHPSPTGEHPSPTGEHPSLPGGLEQSETTIHNNNPKEQSTTTPSRPIQQPTGNDTVVVALAKLLADFGIREPTLSQLTDDDVTIDDARAWINYAQSHESINDPPAFVITKLQQHEKPPPPSSYGTRRIYRKPPAEEVDPEFQAKQQAALAELRKG